MEEINEEKAKRIKEVYDVYYGSILKKGELLVRDTEKGIWGVSGVMETFDVFSQVDLSQCKKFLDLGSGDGKVVMVASLFTHAVGIEFDEKLHKEAVEIREKLGIDPKRADLICGDYMEHDFSQYDVIFINPDKGFHHGVEEKLCSELSGQLLVYNKIFQPRFLEKGRTFWSNQTPVVSYTGK